jgi:hypothetical protein
VRMFAKCVICCLALMCVLSAAVWPARVIGKVTAVSGKSITASFPTPVQADAIMVVLVGDGESVAGTAVSRRCSGSGPYDVTGGILFVSDAVNLAAGKEIYVNSVDTTPAPSRIPAPPQQHTSSSPPTHDLKLYYYAAGQNVGYGTLGLGYEKTVRVSRGLGVELDGGITAVGNISGQNPNVVNTDQLIKTLNGRTRFDFSDFAGFYTAYRWSQGRGDDQRWSDLAGKLSGKQFVAASAFNDQTVALQGLEYGLTLRPWNKLAMSFGYIPQYRADYGTFGVCTAPGYTGELRFGTNHGALRLRGIKSDGYWQADLGITIR